MKELKVCVKINNEEELRYAQSLLIKCGETISIDGTFALSGEEFNYLRFHSIHFDWYLGSSRERTIITINELETILKYW